MINSDKIILDLCGGSGSWSKPYLDSGYTVINVTLPEYDVRTYMPPENIYGILAAPPCQHFSVMRTNKANTPRDLFSAFEIVKHCLRIIWFCTYDLGLKFWALENPSTGMLKRFLGYPAFIFNPYDFGDMSSKKTGLWGYFNIPIKKPILFTQEQKEYQNKNHIHKFPSAKEYPGIDRAGRRAITPPGLARAFYEANK